MMTTVGPGCYDDKAVAVLRTIIIVYANSFVPAILGVR